MNSPQQSPLKWRSTSLLSVVALSIQLIAPVFAVAKDKGHKTETPIQHVIVIIGENRTFDHVFATYKPSPGESVWNLLSKGIVNQDGTPGPNFSLASQFVGHRLQRRRISDEPIGNRPVFDPATSARWRIF